MRIKHYPAWALVSSNCVPRANRNYVAQLLMASNAIGGVRQ